MLRSKLQNSGWQGASLVAITYVYFLIFAQFGFLNRLAAVGIVGPQLKAVMAAMAAGGILFSLLTPRFKLWPSPTLRLTAGFAASATAAFLILVPMGLVSASAIAFLIGSGLGLLTVTLVTHLRLWTGETNTLLKVGIGTGIGYLLCNVPSLFTASPQVQAATAGVLCLVGIAIVRIPVEAQPQTSPTRSHPAIPFPIVVACFAALVWLDSAAFFIIQNTTALKAGTWQGASHLWANGFLHLGAAVLSAWLLRRRGLSFVLSTAFLALAFACLLLLDPARALTASVFYPIGVSLYSVALVAYPSLFSAASSLEQRGRQAGWIYAIGGWAGSALGIGMSQNLGYVPPSFVAAAGALVLLPWLFNMLRHRTRELALVVAVLVTALFVYRLQPSAPVAASLSPVERGRLVYISEGCINCHSQYVRPNTADMLMWGPVESLEELHRQQPPLIGNRRQGPDLSQVGSRRSSLWLKAHLYNPREVSGASIMPSYSFLFRDERGNDLVAYLSSLRPPASAQHISQQQQWRLPASAIADASADDGQRLYSRYCATCHSGHGRTRNTWQFSFVELPGILSAGSAAGVQGASAPTSRIDHFAQIVKFGIPNSDMAGHEYLSDRDVASISLWLSQSVAQPVRKP
jgi:cbb3-type cytochrome c oxidase subunit II